MSSSIKVIKEQNIIDLENIVVQFPSRDGSLFGRKKFTAVNNVSLGIKAGETIGLVGESGCGKSTIGNMLVHLLTPDKGSILFRGQDITSMNERKSTLANVIIGLLKPTSGLVKFNGLQMQYGSSEARKQFGRQVSVIFQDPATALNPRMKVLDILRDPMDIHNVLQPHEREKRVYDLLSRVGLPRSAAQVEPTRLSGGQKQRVAIARALALNPKLIVADEPTPGLEAMTARHVIHHLKEMAQDGAAVLLITVYVIGNRGIQTGISSVTGRTVSDGAPMIAWVQMGLEESKRGPGWYNGYQVKLFQKADGDADLAAAWAQADLRKTISDMAEEPAKAADFFVRKIESIWAEPTFQSLWIQEVGNTSWAEGSPPWELFKEEGGLNRLYVFAANLVQTFVYAMACVWVIAGMSAKGSRSKHVLMNRTWEKRIEAEKAEKTVKAVKKQGMETVWERQERGETDRWGMLLPGIVFIGGFLFHLVWEAKGQYSVVYFMLLLPYAYLGMERVADVFLDVTGAGKE